MGFLDKAEDFEALGIAPPEHITHDSGDGMGFAKELGDHICFWKQRGNHIWCDAGPHEHGRHHDPSHILIGTDETGRPLFKVIDNSSFPTDTDS